MPAHGTYSASDFKAKCLEILNRLSTRTLTRVTITKHGRPIAVSTPPEETTDSVRRVYGFMEGSVVGLDHYELTEPILDEPLLAERGVLHA